MTAKDPLLLQAVAERKITEVMHFTTNRGLTGIMQLDRLVSRAKLQNPEYLKEVESILKLNCFSRPRDADYLDYVNMSISRINDKFFGHSKGWHRHDDVFWQILSFDSEIIAHEGAIFSTTNNIYSGCMRGTGPSGFEAMFKPRVKEFVGSRNTFISRQTDMPLHYTTCKQAELLYPGEIPAAYLRRIYVRTESDRAETLAMIDAGKYRKVPVEVHPALFGE
ncbi:uncharacterized protein DUF4433 [Azospirillum baldaniorum]|uniref:DarT ssDNA thymidine ADP-ribosyltransferase family protein n=1 Tax=Azospirillum baldaniorum TaxID=1064539 RepID=UPI0011AAA86C|nr:DarT ssDNA thymidine ADP-ribosyltransferase family protein [Azospirillum baldaniorum]TWA69753.1 uncharacterized protein DUF4433 [Azospirillum baldaniorum]